MKRSLSARHLSTERAKLDPASTVPPDEGHQPRAGILRRFNEWAKREDPKPASQGGHRLKDLVRLGSRAAVGARLMVRPVCPQLRKCRVCPGGYAWWQEPIFMEAEFTGGGSVPLPLHLRHPRAFDEIEPPSLFRRYLCVSIRGVQRCRCEHRRCCQVNGLSENIWQERYGWCPVDRTGFHQIRASRDAYRTPGPGS